MAVATLPTIVIFWISVAIYFMLNAKSLESERVKARIGSLYGEQEISRLGPSFIGLRLLSVLRKIGLGAAITFAVDFNVVKFCFIILSSFSLLSFLA